MLSSKTIDLQRDSAAGVYLSEARTPYPSLHTVVYTCNRRVYSCILIHTGTGGGES
jgi:hypothetical protein